MEDEDLRLVLTSQVPGNLQGEAGTFRVIGRMQNELRPELACLHLRYIARGQAGAREVAKWPRSVRLDERQIPRHSEDTCPSILLRGELVYAFFSKEDTVVGRLRGI